MPLPELCYIKDDKELEGLLRPFLEGRKSVGMQEISSNVVVIRPTRDELWAIAQALRRIGWKFDPSSNRYVPGDLPLAAEEQGRTRTKLEGLVKRVISGKGDEYIKELECTIREFRRWIQGQFAPGMTWKNYGDWYVAHISEEREESNHWSNLKPKWLLKGGRKR